MHAHTHTQMKGSTPHDQFHSHDLQSHPESSCMMHVHVQHHLALLSHRAHPLVTHTHTHTLTHTCSGTNACMHTCTNAQIQTATSFALWCLSPASDCRHIWPHVSEAHGIPHPLVSLPHNFARHLDPLGIPAHVILALRAAPTYVPVLCPLCRQPCRHHSLRGAAT